MELFSTAALVSLTTLTILEIVLGIDNIIFMSILVVRLPQQEQQKARTIGLTLALVIRILMLFGISLLTQLTGELFSVIGHGFSGRDLIMLAGGLFLIAKSTTEIHNKMEGSEEEVNAKAKTGFMSTLLQIILLDIVFSIDSVVTAVGLSQSLLIMILSNVFAMIVMLFSAKSVGDFVMKHPTVKMLALSFLLMIGFVLFLDGFAVHIDKGYIYAALSFSLFVEVLNLRLRKKSNPVQLANNPKLQE
ncbi:MAG: TerC family protein [Candidatus Kapaibacterium sp.]|nr:TerC family protein [Bacteroidota bacterium]